MQRQVKQVQQQKKLFFLFFQYHRTWAENKPSSIGGSFEKCIKKKYALSNNAKCPPKPLTWTFHSFGIHQLGIDLDVKIWIWMLQFTVFQA